jgi:hypothetical protein
MEEPMKIRLVRTEKDFDFPFPNEQERCANALFFKVGLGSEDQFEVVVAFAMRQAHGRERRRINSA